MKHRSIFWMILLAFLTPICALAQKQREPAVIMWDAGKITQYSNRELIDLLSEKSLEKNAHAKGMYSLLPHDRRAKAAPAPGTDANVQLALDVHALDYTAQVENELIKRAAYSELLKTFDVTEDETQQAWIVDVLAQKRSPVIDDSLRRYTRRSIDEMSTYLALKYFAQACDPEALGILNKHYFKYPTSSMEWVTIVRSFGECKYKPATAHLVETVTAMSVDLGYASHLGLLAIYPDARIEFSDPLHAREEWEKYLARQQQK